MRLSQRQSEYFVGSCYLSIYLRLARSRVTGHPPVDRAAANGTARAILQRRKFGFGCLVVTQRPANVTKSILNQCNTILALRVYDATGMEFLRAYIGDDYANVLSALEDRHAVVFGRASS